jgi:hypothetical protein
MNMFGGSVKQILQLSGLIVPLSFAAPQKPNRVYQCEGPQGTIFSQTPCGDNAKAIDVKVVPQPKIAPQPKEAQGTVATSGSGFEDINKYVEQQDKSRQIARHQRNIARYKKQLAADFKQVQKQRYRTSEDKAQVIAAMSAKYDQLIIKEHEVIKQLSKPQKK